MQISIKGGQGGLGSKRSYTTIMETSRPKKHRERHSKRSLGSPYVLSKPFFKPLSTTLLAKGWNKRNVATIIPIRMYWSFHTLSAIPTNTKHGRYNRTCKAVCSLGTSITICPTSEYYYLQLYPSPNSLLPRLQEPYPIELTSYFRWYPT